MVATTPRARLRSTPLGAGPRGDASAGERAPEHRPARRLLVGLLAAIALLYLVVAGLGDPRGYSGSDAGGKAATAKIMSERGTVDPDIGYWAAAFDPAGIHHPIVNTQRRDDTWIQATSIPFSLAEARLWALGGANAALLLPMLGGVLAAYGAWLLARLLGAGTRVAGFALVLVGGLGPVGFYATDLWEHAPAVGLALVGTAIVLDRPRPPQAFIAGLLLAGAVVLRAEVAVHVVSLGGAVLGIPALRRVWLSARVAVAGLAGAVLVMAANRLAESATVGGGVRGPRASALASGAGQGIGRRAADALFVSGAPFADDRNAGLAAAAFLIAVALVVAAIGLGHLRVPARTARVIVTASLALYLGRFAQGLGFFPGMFAAAPVAAAGFVAGLVRRDPLRRALTLVAVAQLPAIWMLQWSGNHVAQWGGRYTLLPGALLTVVGAVALFETTTWRLYRIGMLGVATAIGTFGFAWHVERSHQVATAFQTIDALPAGTVVVSTDANALREGGAFFGYGTRWLRVATVDEVVTPGGLADQLAIDDLTLLTPAAANAAPRVPGSYRMVEQRVLAMPGVDLMLRRYTR